MTGEQQQNRPIEETESSRWLETMEKADRAIGDDINVLHGSDREGDHYELFDKAIQRGRHVLIRIVHNRMTVENGRILEDIRERAGSGLAGEVRAL